MKLKPKHTIMLTAAAVSAIALSYTMGATHDTAANADNKLLKRVAAPTDVPQLPEGPKRLVAQEGFFYEDFESMRPGVLDSGWTTSPTPGHPSDNWSVATLGKGDDPLHGPSGYQYAYILGNRNPDDPYGHDAWLFSPKVSMKAGQKYKIEFFSYQAPGFDVFEELEVCMMSEADPDGVIETLRVINDNSTDWSYNTIDWEPEEDGEYLLGFHSTSPYMSNATLIDDVRVSSGPQPSYLGTAGVNMGETDLIAGTYSAPYMVENRGRKEMTIDLVSASPEISVKGVPATVNAFDFHELTIEFTPNKVGAYTGYFTLSTSDPSHPEVELMVIADVRDVPVKGFHVEDFEAGGPYGWSLPSGAVNTDYKGGHNGPRAYYVRSFYTLDEEDEIGFKTHYCDMGSNPELSLWYKAIDCTLTGDEKGPTPADSPIFDLYVTEDMGKTWTNVYSMKPGTATAHRPSAEFQQIKVMLPQYANKRCRVKAVLHHAGNPLEKDFIFLVDDVALGTRPNVDLKVAGLHGNSVMKPGEPQSVTAIVSNNGSMPSGDYTIELYDDNNNVYGSGSFASLASGESAEVELFWIPEQKGNINLHAKAVSSSDAIESNNISNQLHVNITDAATTQVHIGEGATYASNGIPVNFSVHDTMVQTMYYANEIGIDAGSIESLTFVSVFDNPYLTENFDVYIAETDRADFADKEIVPEADFVKVFSGDIYMPSGEYQFTIPFDHPYEYKGGNLVVMTRKCSEEFLNTKRFLVGMGQQKRSLSSMSSKTGALAAQNYPDREASEVYAHVGINIKKASSGTVNGVIRNTQGGIIREAKVSLDGTQLYSMTGSNGKYTFPAISAGEHSLTASKFGYYPSTGNIINVQDNGQLTCDITLTPYPKVTVEGTVRTSDGEPIENAKVILNGYESYSTLTDANGHYEISGVYGDTGENYNLRVEALNFNTFWNHEFAVPASGRSYDVVLTADLQPAFNVVADNSNNKLALSWEQPLVEFKHDDGTPINYLGWSHGHARAAIFSTYRQKIRVKQVRFYLSNMNGPHGNINVFLVELNSEGQPDASKMKYLAQGVDFVENGWTTVVLEEPVVMENFAIGISGDGYLGLGATAATEENPFETGMHFWAADDMYNPYDFNDFVVWTPMHPMLRVYGDYLGNPATDPYHESLTPQRIKRPEVAYDVYRIDDIANPDRTTFLGSTLETTFSDPAYADLKSDAQVRYAVVAKYGALEAAPAFSAVVSKSGSSISTVEADMVTFGPNPLRESLKISGASNVKEVRITSLEGKCVKIISNPQEFNDVSDLQDGIYIVTLICNDGSTTTNKTIKKSTL